MTEARLRPRGGRRGRSGPSVTGGIRVRVTALATAVVIVVLAVTAIGLVLTQKRLLTASLEESLGHTADELVENQLAAGPAISSLSDLSRNGASSPNILGGLGDDDTAAQIVALDGEVVAASPQLAAMASLADPPPPGRTEVLRTVDERGSSGQPLRVLSRRSTTAAGTFVVHVGHPLDDIAASTRTLTRSLMVAIPLVVAVLAGLMWTLVGRTLAPVEAGAERQRRFVADASHELRSPLTRIRSELEVDLAHPGGADLAATHRSVLDEVARLEHLVDSLLILARADADGHTVRRDRGLMAAHDETPQPGAVDLDDIVLEEARRLRGASTVHIDVSGVNAAQVLGDRAHLSRALSNVAANAARYAASTVTMTLAEVGDRAVLAVSDDGPGIPFEERDRVFERFTRLDAARVSPSPEGDPKAGSEAELGPAGFGLGLAIAREIIERHHGTIALELTNGAGALQDGTHQDGTHQGACFVISLPLG